MKLLTAQPHVLLWLCIPFILIIGYTGNDAFDINIYDTYYIIAGKHIAWLISLYFAGLALIYWGLARAGRKPNIWLTLFNLGCTIDVSFIFWLLYLWTSGDSGFKAWWFTGLVILFLFGQLVFFVNVMLCLMRKPDRKSEKHPD